MVTRPTIALVGERGPEAVVPLHRAGEFGFPNGGGGAGVTVNLNVDRLGGTFADLPADTQGRIVGDAFSRMVKGSGGFRAAASRSRRGL